MSNEMASTASGPASKSLPAFAAPSHCRDYPGDGPASTLRVDAMLAAATLLGVDHAQDPMPHGRFASVATGRRAVPSDRGPPSAIAA
jgi:hypothetical protein